MSGGYTLLVVDMQPFFPDANDAQTIANVEREIRLAIDSQCDIIFIEIPYFSPMDEEGLLPTHRRLSDLVKGYKNAKQVEKLMFPRSSNAGARCVVNGCEAFRFAKDRFRVCGVCAGGWVRNEDGSVKLDQRTNEPLLTGCVFDIVVGLTIIQPEARIEVVADACRDSRKIGKNVAQWVVNWDDYRGLANVTVI